MRDTYDIIDSVIHPVEVRCNSLKERRGSHTQFLQCSTIVYTTEVKVEILGKLNQYFDTAPRKDLQGTPSNW